MNFISAYFSALKRCGLGLFVIYIAFTFFDQSLTVLMESNLRSQDGATGAIFLLGALYLTNSIFFTTLATVTAIYGVSKLGESVAESWWSFIDRVFNQSCIEVVRAWGKILSWSLLFLIPGFFKYLQYILVPFVVAVDPQYQNGEVDALKKSKELFKKHWLGLLTAVFFFQVVWSYISTDLFDAYRLVVNTPIQAVLISGLEALIFLFYILMIFKIIQRSGSKNLNTNLQSEASLGPVI